MPQVVNGFLADLLNPATWIGALVYLVVILILAWLVNRLLQRGITRLLAQDTEGLLDRTLFSFLRQLLRVGIYVLALVVYASLVPALRSLGAAILAGAGVTALIIGLAAQSTFSNLVAGFVILLYRPFRVGDRIQIAAPTGVETGDVENITLGYTVLRTRDNRRVVVPNNTIVNQTTINLTSVTPRVIAEIDVGIGYGSNIDKARSILEEVVRSHPLVEELIEIPVVALGDSAVVLRVRAWCRNAQDAVQVRWDVLEAAKKRFDAAGIEIPFPYRNVVLHQPQ